MTERSAWERMRMLATICVQPYSKKRLKATELMRFPWDDSLPRPLRRRGVVSKEEALKRFEEVVKRQKASPEPSEGGEKPHPRPLPKREGSD